jgi:putative effector of murein hydrolase
MPKFVELWVYLSATPLFGLTATLMVYALAQAAYVRLRQAPWANPVLWTVVVLAAGLLATGVPYPSYFSGAQFIHFLLGPAVVALAWPLWLRRQELRQRCRRCHAAAGLDVWLAVRGHFVAGTQVGDGAGGDGYCRTDRRHSGFGGGLCGDYRTGGRAQRQIPV